MIADNQSSDTSLIDRHKREEKYHDLKNQSKIGTPRHYKFNPTYQIFLKMKQRINLQTHEKILEMGCGSGWITTELAATGASVYAFDISGEAVDKTREFLEKQNLDSNCNIQKMAAEEMDYPDDHFDCVIGFAILHHLNLDIALPEIHRVLKPGGRAFFAEPLGENPLINFYRKLTPEYRTVDEKPLIIGTLRKKVSFFRNFRHDEFFLTALLAIAVAYVPILNKCFSPLLKFLMNLDDKLLARCPAMGRWAWYSIIELKK